SSEQSKQIEAALLLLRRRLRWWLLLHLRLLLERRRRTGPRGNHAYRLSPGDIGIGDDAARFGGSIGGAAAGRLPGSILGADQIAGAQGRIRIDVERDQPERVLAVAGAVRHQLLAEDEGVAEIRVGADAGRRRGVDRVAVEDLGLARRAHGTAHLPGRRV